MKFQIWATMALAGMAMAQQGPGDPWALKAYLGLSDEQLMQMAKANEQGHLAVQEKAKALQPQLEQKHKALQEVMSKPNADPTAIGKAVLEVRAIEKQIRELQQSARSGALGVLTQEQRAKFKNIEDAALLPEATREAVRMGLTAVTPRQQQNGPGAGQDQMRRAGSGMRPGPNGPGPGPGQNMGPRPNGQGPGPNNMGPRQNQNGPGPQQNMGPRPNGPGPQGQPGMRPRQPMPPPQPPQQEER